MSTNEVSFDRLLRNLVIGILATIVILTGLVFLRGPHIRLVTFDPAETTVLPRQWLVLSADQPLGTIQPNNVSVSPNEPIHVLSSGNEIAIQFSQRLAYDTRYTVTINKMPLKLTYAFTTDQPTLYYWQGSGTIKAHVLGQKQDRTIFSATNPIVGFAVTGHYVAVAVNGSTTDSLYIVNAVNGHATKATLPGNGLINRVQASPDGTDFTFSLLTTPKTAKPFYNSTLFSYSAVTNKYSEVYGFGHTQLNVQDWAYSPDGGTIIIQDFDSIITAINLGSQSPPVPLGEYSTISGFSYDGSELYLDKLQGTFVSTFIVNPTTHAAEAINQQPYGPGSDVLIVDPLQNSNGYVSEVQNLQSDGLHFEQYTVLTQGNSQKTLFTANTSTSFIDQVAVSPNDQYVSVKVSPAFYSPGSGFTDHTDIIDTRTGKIVDTIGSTQQVIWN